MFEKYHKVNRKDYKTWYGQNEKMRKEVAKDPNRLQFHLMPKTGWLNDPNGLCQFQETYHIYYQYTPFEPTGELKLWGHYTTKDFVNYEDHGPVLFPDADMDAHGVYSGSAFIEDDTINFFYTGNIKYFDRDDYDYINSGRGSNTIRVTSKDGQNLTDKKLLMTTDDYPEDMSNHVRDPKVWKENDTYYMVLGARDLDSKGLVLMYQSKDMTNWEFVRKITTKEAFGYMWECPDLFELDGETFLISCPQGVIADGIDYANVHQMTAMKLKDYEVETIQQLDRGSDMYAPQTFVDERGRRILIGWMGIPEADYTNPTTEDGWQHALTIPRQLSVRNGRLIQQPLEELKKLRTKDHAVCTFCYGQEIVLHNVVYEAVVEYNECDSMYMILREGITLKYKDGILTLDLGEYGSGRDIRQVHVEKLEHLQVFADTSSVEVFINHGEEVFTSRIYSLHGRIAIGGECKGTMDVYPLRGFSIEDMEESQL